MIKSSTTSLSYTTNTYYGCVFYRCDSLMFISVPSSVKYISDFFPKRNKLLEKFYCYAINPPTLKDNITGPYSILFVPEQSIDLYKKASNWENFPFILPIESEATYVSQEKLYRDVKTSSKDGTVTLRGLKNGETVTFYNLNGKKIGQTVAKNGKASTKAGNEAIVIAKFGSSTIKIAVK